MATINKVNVGGVDYDIIPGEVIEDLDDIIAAPSFDGQPAGAKAVKQLNDKVDSTDKKVGNESEAASVTGSTAFAKIASLYSSFSSALTDLKNTAIAKAVGANGNTFTAVIAKLATIVNRGAVSQTLGLGGSYTIPAGYHNGSGKVSVTITSQEKTVTAGTSATSVSPDSGKVLSKVTVNPTPSQSKSVAASTSNTTVRPDSGKLLSSVTVTPQQHSGVVSRNANGRLDLGATHSTRYVDVACQLHLLGTYSGDTNIDVSGIAIRNNMIFISRPKDGSQRVSHSWGGSGSLETYAESNAVYTPPILSLNGTTLSLTCGRLRCYDNHGEDQTKVLETEVYFVG